MKNKIVKSLGKNKKCNSMQIIMLIKYILLALNLPLYYTLHIVFM